MRSSSARPQSACRQPRGTQPVRTYRPPGRVVLVRSTRKALVERPSATETPDAERNGAMSTRVWPPLPQRRACASSWRFTPAALQWLDGRAWPGDVRELRAAVECCRARTGDRHGLTGRPGDLPSPAGAGGACAPFNPRRSRPVQLVRQRPLRDCGLRCRLYAERESPGSRPRAPALRPPRQCVPRRRVHARLARSHSSERSPPCAERPHSSSKPPVPPRPCRRRPEGRR